MIVALPSLTQVTAPVSEPISLSELKLYLRVSTSAEDTLLNNLITAARIAAEHYLKLSLMPQSWRLSYDDYAPDEIKMRRGPVQSITSVKTFDRSGAATTLSSDVYYLNAAKDVLTIEATLVSHRIEVEYSAGYADAASVPANIRQGIIQHAGYMYERRAESTEMPTASRNLYDLHRMVVL